MKFRLALVAWAVLMIASCGGPSEESGDQQAPGDARRTAHATGEVHAEKRPSIGRVEDRAEQAGLKSPVPEASGKALPAEPEVSPVDGSNHAGREWRAPDGRVLAVGELVTQMDGNVCLETSDGQGITIPLESLSAADRQYVRRQSGDAPDQTDQTDQTGQTAIEPAGEPSGGFAVEAASRSSRSPRRQKVVIPFDFVSKFDNGRYGAMVGEMVYKKLEREGGFIIPGSMLEVRDFCASSGARVTPDMPLERVGQVVVRDFDADVGIWGSVERVPGHEWEVYDLWIQCVDFTTAPEPKVIYEKINVRTKSVSEIPHRYVQEMLDALYDRRPGGPPAVDQFAEQNWIDNPNLVPGGDFQRGSGGVPAGWESRGGQLREPLGGLVRWVSEGTGGQGNKAIRFTFDKGVGDGYGVMYYSQPFPVEEGAKYRFQCRWRTNGPNVKVFIKCYDRMTSDYKGTGTSRPSPSRSPTGSTGPGRPGGIESVAGMGPLRECYRSQQNLYGPKNTWNTQTQDFTPKHTKYSPQVGRVMLYAYLGAGVVEFDDVLLKQIVPPSPGESKKALRHSLESDVTLEEMRENEERARKARETKPEKR